jgi:adenylate cyclase
VLPFVNMSRDPEQEFLADGIAEDVITALSRYPSLFVIARTSCFAYKDRSVEVRRVGRELGVRYVLEGSLRKAGNRIRITAQLAEAESGNHVWAERYDRDLADIFAVQDEISEAVTIAIVPAVSGAEQQRAMRRRPDSLDAWAVYQRGLWHLDKGSVDDNSLSENFFRRAIDLDPNFADGYASLAWAQIRATTVFQTRSLADIPDLALPLARQAVRLDGANAAARSCLSAALLFSGDHDGGLAEAERSLLLSPNLAFAYWSRGAALNWSERPREGLEDLRKSLRLDPRGADLPYRLLYIAIGSYIARAYQEAASAARQAIRAFPDFPMSYRWLATALGQTGPVDDAREALAKAMAVASASFDMYIRNRPPWIRPQDHAHMLEGLRKAGWEG